VGVVKVVAEMSQRDMITPVKMPTIVLIMR
jgi:hypothetical protein